MKKTLITTFLSSAMLASGVFADSLSFPGNQIPGGQMDDIQIVGVPILSGDGCKEGTVHATLTEDKQTITVLFDDYYADSIEGRRGKDRKTCNIGVPVSIPDGLSVAVIGLDYRGYVDVEAGASASLSAEYFYAQQGQGPKFTEVWKDENNDIDEDFFVSHRVNSITYSNCGDDAIIRANTSLKTEAERAIDAQAFVQVDSLDVSSEMMYQLQWRTCNNHM